MKDKLLRIGTVLTLLSSMAASATDKLLATEQLYGSQVSFSAKASTSNTTLSISGPGGFHASKLLKSGIPSINLYDYGELKDGLYKYEITSSVGKKVRVEDTLNNGRGENNWHYANQGSTQSGNFRVMGGQIQQFKQPKEKPGNGLFTKHANSQDR